MLRTIATAWMLFNMTTGIPAPYPNLYASDQACTAAAATYMRVASRSGHQELYRCEELNDVLLRGNAPLD